MGEGGVVGGFGAEAYLNVISISVEFQGEMAENLSEREDVNLWRNGPSTEPWGTPCVSVDETVEWL